MKSIRIAVLVVILYVFNLLPTYGFEGDCERDKCNHFEIGDMVTHSYYYIYQPSHDFIGIVTKIEPKPTNENLHWISVERISGNGKSGIYSEHFLMIHK